MKSLIILKGIAKTEKIRWIKKEGLQDFFLDINVIRKLYSSPELITPFRGILNKSFGDTVYTEFLRVLITKMSKGCLIVIDPEAENLKIFEKLSIIFGYTIFYVILETPNDLIKNQKLYNLSYYPLKRKEELKKEIKTFSEIDWNKKILVKSYKDVENYWEKRKNYCKKSKTVLHVSDIHSNFSLYNLLPDFKKYGLVVFHGDYIDGPEEGGSRLMIDTILDTKQKNIVWLEGNHELRLRKQLGITLLSAGGKYKELKELLYNSIPSDYLRTTYKEFLDITPGQALWYLRKMNEQLKLFVIIETGKIRYICTHSGFRYIEQISPKYIGNVVYGNRDISKIDKDFASHTQNSPYWSIHAHCKYYEEWCTHKYRNVVNLDPSCNEEIIYAEQKHNNWKICQIKR